LELVVGDLDAELVLRGDRDLDHGERVDVEVVHEALLRGHVGRRDAGDLVDDLAEAGEDVLLGQCHVATTPRIAGSWLFSITYGRPYTSISGEFDHLRGVGEAGAEAEQQGTA